MKSIKMNYVLHHIYNFGTTSMFISMGKEKYVPVVIDPEEKTFGVQKLISTRLHDRRTNLRRTVFWQLDESVQNLYEQSDVVGNTTWLRKLKI
ncbi:MAG: hypothetical protein MZU97_00600 [Bacillus subtilis]|nr:hypothetical protein [Bacillus subtilis]